jgi:hypothetical protein
MYPLHAIVIPVITAAKCPKTDCYILGGNKKKVLHRPEKEEMDGLELIKLSAPKTRSGKHYSPFGK